MNTIPQPSDPAGKVRRDLTEIIDLSARLLSQAVNDANAQIDGTSLPGGRAMIALALVNDPETFERRVELAERAWFAHAAAVGAVRLVDGVTVLLDEDHRPDLAADEDDDDTAPALQIIRYWSERYRWQLGMVWDHIPTISTEARFLRNPEVLAYVAAHHASDWVHLARDINRARRHLESILYAGSRPDRSRVICNNPTCTDRKKLIKVHGPTYVVAWSCLACGTTVPEERRCDSCGRRALPSPDDECRRMVGKKADRHPCEGQLVSVVALDHCPNLWCHTAAPAAEIRASDPTTDRWKCTGCKKRYDTDEFEAAYAAMLKDTGAERFVTVAEAVATLVKQGRPEVTVRSWLKPPRRHVEDRCTVCKRRWPPREYNVCPGKVKGSLEKCGGELRPVRRGNPDDVIEAYCDLATHKTYVWWPDMWRRHLVTKAKADRQKARAAERRAAEEAEAAATRDGADTA